MLLLVLAACASKGDDTGASLTRPFPAGFRWGTATAGFQVDMGCPTLPAAACDDVNSDWYQWVNDPDIVADPSMHQSPDALSMGPGMWETFEDDAARMQSDGMTAWRGSIEWSRIFPDPAAETATTVDELDAFANADAVARYHEILASARAHGLEPMITVNHYTLPVWLHDGVACHDDIATCVNRGWVDKDRIVPLIGLYAAWLGTEFGGDVDTWFTLNEPYATSLAGYILPSPDRVAPPGLDLDTTDGKAVILNQIDGSAAIYDGIHATDAVDADGDGVDARVGIVMNMIALKPKDPSNAEDLEGVQHADYLYHELYLAALTTGAWDADLDGVAETTRPELAGRLDLLGINYYNLVTITGLPFSVSADIPTFDLVPDYSLDPYPEGLGEVVARARAWDLPMMITENGTSEIEGQGAADILDGHLSSLYDQIADGADVSAYFYWSYVDNYEWNHGMELHFGLYSLDTVTKERTARPVLERYRVIAGQNGLE